MKNLNILKYALFSAIGTFLYTAFIAFLLSHGEAWFGQAEHKGPWMPMAMLMLFIVSASITGSLVLGKPLLLAMKGKTKEGLILLLTTVLFLAIITALVFVGISRIA